jgi:hypothetical protein
MVAAAADVDAIIDPTVDLPIAPSSDSIYKPYALVFLHVLSSWLLATQVEKSPESTLLGPAPTRVAGLSLANRKRYVRPHWCEIGMQGWCSQAIALWLVV